MVASKRSPGLRFLIWIAVACVLVGALGLLLGPKWAPSSYWLAYGILFGPLYLFGLALFACCGVYWLIRRGMERRAEEQLRKHDT
jgi:cyanate permease